MSSPPLHLLVLRAAGAAAVAAALASAMALHCLVFHDHVPWQGIGDLSEVVFGLAVPVAVWTGLFALGDGAARQRPGWQGVALLAAAGGLATPLVAGSLIWAEGLQSGAGLAGSWRFEWLPEFVAAHPAETGLAVIFQALLFAYLGGFRGLAPRVPLAGQLWAQLLVAVLGGGAVLWACYESWILRDLDLGSYALAGLPVAASLGSYGAEALEARLRRAQEQADPSREPPAPAQNASDGGRPLARWFLAWALILVLGGGGLSLALRSERGRSAALRYLLLTRHGEWSWDDSARYAASQLATVEGSEGRAFLREVLATAEQPSARRMAAQFLCYYPEPGLPSLEPLLWAAATDPAWEVRQGAEQTLSKFGLDEKPGLTQRVEAVQQRLAEWNAQRAGN